MVASLIPASRAGGGAEGKRGLHMCKSIQDMCRLYPDNFNSNGHLENAHLWYGQANRKAIIRN